MSSLGMPPLPQKIAQKETLFVHSPPAIFFDGVPFIVEKFGAEVDH